MSLDNLTLQEFDQRSPTSSWEIVEVTFGAADTDQEIQTGLSPNNPDKIHFRVVDASGPPLIYRDTSPTRLPWSRGVIRLRSAVAGLKAVILLTVVFKESNVPEGGSKILARGVLPPEIAYEDEANVFTLDQQILKTVPIFKVTPSAGTSSGRVSGIVPGVVGLLQNLFWTGAAWGVDNTALSGWALRLLDSSSSDILDVLRAPAPGGGAVSPATLLSLSAAGVLSLNGGRIQFPASQIADGGANVLDDYEEGTWTPSDASGAGLGAFGLVNTPWYYKVGRLVVAGFYAIMPTSASGLQAIIGGLPFTVDAQNGGAHINFTTAGAALGTFTGYVRGGTNHIDLYNLNGAGITLANVSAAQISMVAVYGATA